MTGVCVRQDKNYAVPGKHQGAVGQQPEMLEEVGLQLRRLHLLFLVGE